MGRAALLFERGNLIVELLPFAAENVSTCDDNVNVLGSRLDGAANFGDPLGQRRKSCRKSSGDGSNSHVAALKRPARCLHKLVIYTNRGDLDLKILDTELLHQRVLNRLPGLGTQAENPFVRIVSRESREIHAS